jgi:membrane protease YdiL (CAAX protease family)
MNAAPDLSFPQHSLPKSIVLHILPGAATTLVFVLLKPLLDPTGFPPLLAFLLAVLLVDLPLQLGIMLFEGKQLNGRLSLNGVVLYRDKIAWKTFALVFVAAFVVVYALITLTTPLTASLTDTLFSGWPAWMFLEEPTQYRAFAKGAVIAVFVLQLVLTGVALPWVEELYFRGYLLPRMSRYGAGAPLIGGLLFALYHGWQLYAFVTVFLLGTALGYVVWWRRDIRLSIALHVVANALTRLMFLMAALAL